MCSSQKDGLYEETSRENPEEIVVRPKCNKHQEAAGYSEEDGLAAADQLSVICPRIPGHVIFGTRADVM